MGEYPNFAGLPSSPNPFSLLGENVAKNIESSPHRVLGDSKRTQRQSRTTRWRQ
jgi:hypothetical protein